MQFTQDLSFALRSARQRPGFVIVLVGALALGIGLTTAIFSVFYGVLLKPLAFQDPDRLVLIREKLPKLVPIPINMPAPDALEFSQSVVFSDSAIFISAERNLEGGDRPERVNCLRASARLLPLLGVRPLRGRGFSQQEDAAAAPVALISASLERRRFGGVDPLGKTLLLDGQPYQVVGVLPPDLVFPTHGMLQLPGNAEVWIPLSLTAEERGEQNDNYDYSLIGRLRAGLTIQQAQAAERVVVNRIASRLAPEIRAQVDLGVAVLPLKDQIVGDSRRLLFLLLGAVGALLLISCVNVSNMLLSRAYARRRELAVRTALGATGRRLVGQMLNENLFLFVLGGLLGALCAIWSQTLLLRLLPPDLPRTQDIRIDASTLAFTLVVSLVTGLIFGLAPALGSLRLDLTTALQEGSRSQSGGRLIGRTRRALVAAQIALAFVLLTSAGLLMRSFFAVLNRQSELRSEHVLTFGIALPEREYSKIADAQAFDRELNRRLSALPGAMSAGFGTDLPLEGRWQRLISPDHLVNRAKPVVDYSNIEGAYFRSLGLRLTAGRFFDNHDRKGSEPVAIVNESFGKTFWPGETPLGHRFKIGPPQSKLPWVRIVGIVADTSARDPDTRIGPHVYCPLDQEPFGVVGRDVWFVLRTQGHALDLANTVRGQVHALDPSLPVVKLRSMEQVLSVAVAPRSANTWLVTTFALGALLLTSLGVYGVVAHSVTDRTREIGIRIALGALRSQVFGSVLWEGVQLALLGLAAGLPASFAVARLIGGLLYGITTTDALTVAGVITAVAITTFCAMLVPSWRAMHVDPQVALREE
jgi:predicted permease